MIVKSKHVRVSRTSQSKASSALKSHLKYLQYRERDLSQETKEDRHLFDKQRDTVERREVHEQMMDEPAGNIYYHRLILSSAHDEPVENWHEWTRAVMHDLEDRLEMDLEWYATHHHNTDDPHMHIVLRGTGTNRETALAESVELNTHDFQAMRESGREHSDYDHYRLIQETLREFDARDTTLYDSPTLEQEVVLDKER